MTSPAHARQMPIRAADGPEFTAEQRWPAMVLCSATEPSPPAFEPSPPAFEPTPPPPPVSQPLVRTNSLPPEWSVRRARRVLQPVFRGARALSPDDLNTRERMAALRSLVGSGPVWAGLSAAHLLGADTQAIGLPLDLANATSGRFRHRDGVRMRRLLLTEEDIVETDLGHSMTALRTALDLAVRGTRPLDIARVDQVLRVGRVSVADLGALVDRSGGMRGIRTARANLAELDPRAESIPESVLRLELVRLGLPPPTPQLEVRAPDGRVIARLDLGWKEQRVGVEYDGEYHDADRQQRSRDRGRHNELRAVDWTVYQVDAILGRNPTAVFDLLRPHLLMPRD